MISNPLMPNLKKVFWIHFTRVIAVGFMIALLVYFVSFFIDFSIFLLPFDVLDIELDISAIKIIWIFCLVVFFMALSMGFVNYIYLKNTKYTFYNNRMVISKRSHFKEIFYKNISRILYDQKKLFDVLFNSRSIILELTGLKDKTIKLEFIDNADKVLDYIQNLIEINEKLEYSKINVSKKIEYPRINVNKKVKNTLAKK